MTRTALVLGGGLGGLAVAERLRALLPRSERVILVERESEHVFPPSLLWILNGSRNRSQVSRNYDGIARRGIEVLRAEVMSIDPAARRVRAGNGTLQGDAIVIALGAEYDTAAIPGLTEGGLCLYTLDGATAAHAALEAFRGGRIVILTATPQYKCPAGPYEAALLVDAFCRERGIRAQTEIAFHAAEPGPMMVAGPEVSKAVRAMVEERGIVYRPEHQVGSIDKAARKMRFNDGTEDSYDLLFYIPPHRAPAAVREAGLTNESGWVPVDRHTLQTRFEGVYAIGDVTVIPLKMGRPLPKAGVFAHGQAEVVARNIAHAWTGRGSPQRFSGDGMCFIEAGAGRAGMGRGNFYAEPLPDVRMHAPSLLWHGAKVLYEKYWLYLKL